MLEVKDTGARVFKKKKEKRSSKKKNSGDLKKKVVEIFSGDLQNFYNSKNCAVLEQRQGNFQKLEASRPRPRSSKCVLEDSTSDDNF